tara:strand:+ start:3481 stop:6861 length:3381 start_codon:yes stop_codon:yes gene_type:complete
MKLLRYYLSWLVGFAVLIIYSGLVLCYIPPELEFTAVFDYKNEPVSGNQTVTVRLYSSDALIYKEIVKDVYFDKGVGKILIGGEGSDLINNYFYDPNMTVSISVMQHHLVFPVNSVPYTIRTKESNKARRIDNESIVKFLEEEQRIGVNLLDPEVTFDVAGVIVLNNKLTTDELSNGVMYYSGNDNEFLAYRNGVWESMSWIPDPEDQSKWVKDSLANTIQSQKSVGIGRVPNSYALSVSDNVLISGDASFGGHLDIFGHARLNPSSYGFDSTGRLTIPSLQFLTSNNQWSSAGNLTFSGILHGNGAGLINVHHFDDASFSSQHLANDLIDVANFTDQSIESLHITNGIIATQNVATGQVSALYIADSAIQANHIVDGSIQTHHMKKNEISSQDIQLNTFNNEKYADDSIRTHHIVDGAITGAKIMPNNIASMHLSSESITSAKIRNGTLGSAHVPLNSLPISEFSGVFSISDGGTGQTSFDNFGIVHANASGQYQTNLGALAIQNGQMGIGAMPETGVQLLVQRDTNATVGLVADAAFNSTLMLRHLTSSWDVRVNSVGTLSFVAGNDPVMSIGVNGNLGIGTENMSEALTLTGPLVLGSSRDSSGVPGSIKYDSGQFSVHTSSWQTITSGQLSKRQLNASDRTYAQQSSIIFSEDAELVGQQLMVYSVESSNISGQVLGIQGVRGSTVSGANSLANQVVDSLVFLDGSQASQMHSSEGQFTDASMVLIQDSLVHAEASSSFGVLSSTVNMRQAEGNFIDDTRLNARQSKAQFLTQTMADLSQSSVAFLSDSTLSAYRSTAQFLQDVHGQLRGSDVRHGNHLDLKITRSKVQHASNAIIEGEGVLVLGGDGHHVSGNDHVSLMGDRHTIQADRGVAIGSNIDVNHDDVVMINASGRPLSSDRPGQLKIQADGGVRIQFSDELGISMADSMGSWAHLSDASMKMSKLVVDPIKILNKVRNLPIHYWEYKSQKDIQHIGPTAQDFYGAFNYGNSDKVIHSIDSDGVLLASIKGLSMTLDDIEQLLKDHQKEYAQYSAQTQQLLDQYQKLKPKMVGLEQNYARHFRLLDQFESDFDAQQHMILFIEDHIFRIRWEYYLTILESNALPIVLGGFFVGMLVSFIRRRVFS